MKVAPKKRYVSARVCSAVSIPLFLLTACAGSLGSGTPTTRAPAAQSPGGGFDAVLVRTAEGVLLVWNLPDKAGSFTLEIAGDSIGKTETSHPVVVVDNVLYQVQIAHASEFQNRELVTEGPPVLVRHMDWEAEHIEKLVQQERGPDFDLRVDVEQRQFRGRDALVWRAHVDPTATGSRVAEQIFATTAVGEWVIVVSTPRPADDPLPWTLNALTTAMRSIQVRSGPTDIEEEREKVRSRRPPPPKPDIEKALGACEAGVAAACSDLGMRYFLGNGGVRRDFRLSLAYGIRACESGHAHGCVLAASHFLNGIGVELDRQRAIELLAKGCSLGLETACKLRGKAEREQEKIEGTKI